VAEPCAEPDIEMRSEERRALVLLGITAVLASFLGAMLATIWSSNGKINSTDFYFNLPAVSSPARHATFYWIPILEALFIGWMIYAFFAFWYFSADWLPFEIRSVFHVGATISMGFYFLFIILYVPLTYIWVVWITDPQQQAIFLTLSLLLIAVLEADFVRFATGRGYRAWTVRLGRVIKKRLRRRPSLIGGTD